MVADRGLGQVECLVEVADARLAPGVGGHQDISRSLTGSASAFSSGATCSACAWDSGRADSGGQHAAVPAGASTIANLAGRMLVQACDSEARASSHQMSRNSHGLRPGTCLTPAAREAVTRQVLARCPSAAAMLRDVRYGLAGGGEHAEEGGQGRYPAR